MRFQEIVLLAPLTLAAIGCGGLVDQPENIAPAQVPAVNTRFDLRIDGRRVALGRPEGTRFIIATPNTPSTSHVDVGANEETRGGDSVRGAHVLLKEPLRTGAFDCTPALRSADSPAKDGVSSGAAAFNPGSFFGFTATLTDCTVHLDYITSDRVVGRVSANAHAPAQSSLSGKVSKVEVEFDVPVTTVKLP